MAYALTYGAIPVGLPICHRCDNRACVRPTHLYRGTKADNVRDAVSRGRNTYGERVGTAKLTVLQVREMRARYARGGVTEKRLAEEYGISPSQAGAIVTGKNWRKV